MLVFDDTNRFVRVLLLEVPWVHNFRVAALGKLESIPEIPLWCAFRITVEKVGRALDLDNVPKTIIDTFCMRQMVRDGSAHVEFGLYPDDNFDYDLYPCCRSTM